MEKFLFCCAKIYNSCNRQHFFKIRHLCEVPIRGGVEDTRPEAKAKDTKKIPGQGQPFRGQTLSRPRPRTKDTAASVFHKKKGLQKSFSGSLQFIGIPGIFDWGGLNHKSLAMTSSKIWLLALNQDFANGESLN